MDEKKQLQDTIEKFWESVPPVWGKVRHHTREYATQGFKVTLIQFHILRHIKKGLHTVAELAEWQQISRPAVSQAVALLVEKSLVTRTQDKHDRRYVYLALTEEGDAMLTDVFSESRQWMAEKMSGLSNEELQSVTTALDILMNTFLPHNE